MTINLAKTYTGSHRVIVESNRVDVPAHIYHTLMRRSEGVAPERLTFVLNTLSKWPHMEFYDEYYLSQNSLNGGEEIPLRVNSKRTNNRLSLSGRPSNFFGFKSSEPGQLIFVGEFDRFSLYHPRIYLSMIRSAKLRKMIEQI